LGPRKWGVFVVWIHRGSEIRRRRWFKRPAPLRRIALELLHLALELMAVENGGDAIAVGSAVVAVDEAGEAEEKQESSEGTQDLEHD